MINLDQFWWFMRVGDAHGASRLSRVREETHAMFEANKDYYRRRADEQTALGKQAASTRVAAAHYELALRYALLSSRFGGRTA